MPKIITSTKAIIFMSNEAMLTKAGPGQRPVIAQPIPKIAAPEISRVSMVQLFIFGIGSPENDGVFDG